MKNSVWVFVAATFVVMVVAGFLTAPFGHTQVATSPANDMKEWPLKAFTVELIQSAGSHNGETQKTAVEAYRADGSSTAGPKQPGGKQDRLLTLFPEQVRVRISDRFQLKSTTPFPVPSDMKRVRVRSATCAFRTRPGYESQFVDEEIVLGFRTFKFKHSVAKDGGATDVTIHTTSWYAPDLACYELKQHGEKRRPDGTVIATYDKTPLFVTVGEPDKSLFEIPAQYREVPPSEIERAMLAQEMSDRGDSDGFGALSTKMKDRWDADDQRYRELRQFHLIR